MAALRHLRSSDSLRVLWIDAICINQEDIPERKTEVQRMGSIYGLAAQTVIWLGPASENSDLAMETLEKIGQDVTYDSKRHSLATGLWTEALAERRELIIAKKPQWEAIRDLLYREWLRRLWIYQEVKLSKTPVVVAGFSEISWLVFPGAVF
jgi:hypothetical protein